MVLLEGYGIILDIPSNRHHLCSLHDALTWPRIMFGVTGVLLTIPSSRHCRSLLLLILSTRPESHWVLLASLWLFHPPGIFSFSYMAYSTGSGWYFEALTSFKIFHPKESSLSFTWTMPFPLSSRQLLFHLTYLITGSWSDDLSFTFSLELGQKSSLLCPAARLSPPSQPSSLFLFHVDYDDNFHQYM